MSAGLLIVVAVVAFVVATVLEVVSEPHTALIAFGIGAAALAAASWFGGRPTRPVP